MKTKMFSTVKHNCKRIEKEGESNGRGEPKYLCAAQLQNCVVPLHRTCELMLSTEEYNAVKNLCP